MYYGIANYVDVKAIDSDTGDPVTGLTDVDCKIRKDEDGSSASSSNGPATELDNTNHPGIYRLQLSATECTAKKVLLTWSGTGAVFDDQLYYTRPPNFSALGIESGGAVSELDGHTAQTEDNDTKLSTLIARLTDDRAGYLDKLDVSGALANTDNAASFKATGFSTHDAAAVVSAMQAVADDFKATGFSTHDPAAVVSAMQAVADDFKANVSGLSTHDAAAVVSAMQAVADDFKANVSGLSTHDAAAVVSAMQAVADQFKADVSGLSTHDAAAVAALLNDLSQADIRSALGLAAANLDTQLGAKAEPGDAMTLTADERTTLAAAIEAAIINELDGTAVMQAIADLIADDMTTGDLSVQAIATASRDAILDRVLNGNHDGAGTLGKIIQDAATAAALTVVDSVVDAIKEVTDNLPDSGYLTTITGGIQSIDGNTTGLPAAVNTIDGVVDGIDTKLGTPTEESIAADVEEVRLGMEVIASKTANLPADPAGVSDLPSEPPTVEEIDAELSGNHGAGSWEGAGSSAPTVEEIRTEMDDNSTKLASIDGKTTNLPADPVGVSDLPGAAPTVGEINAELASKHGSGSWESGGAGSGARTVTVTVTDGTDPVQNAKVRLSNGAESYVLTSNASGVCVFNLDDATWRVAISRPFHSFQGAELEVAADVSVTYELTPPVRPSEPSDPSLGVVWGYTEEITGQKMSNVEFAFQLKTYPAVAGALVGAHVIRVKTNSDGYFELELQRNDTITPEGTVYEVHSPGVGFNRLTFILEAEDFNVATLVSE